MLLDKNSPVSILDEILAQLKVLRYPVDSYSLHDRVDLIAPLGPFTLLRSVHDAKLDLVEQSRTGRVGQDDLGTRHSALDACSSTCNSASRTRSRDKRMNVFSRLAQNLRSSAVVVRIVVCSILKLVGEETSWPVLECLTVRTRVGPIDVFLARLR